jgi:lincosamide nucleotidyltransferase A/C/D/E
MRAARRPDAPGAVPYEPIAMMTGHDVTTVLERLDGAGIDAWLDGGWAVDALLGEQTRAHEDLDLIVRVSDVPAMRDALAGDGFELDHGETHSNFVLRDGAGREIDVHPVTFDAHGNGVYRMENGGDWVFPADGFSGRGRVEAREVRCLTADVQMLCHATGYMPGETDIHDMRLLNARLGTVLLPPYDER